MAEEADGIVEAGDLRADGDVGAGAEVPDHVRLAVSYVEGRRHPLEQRTFTAQVVDNSAGLRGSDSL